MLECVALDGEALLERCRQTHGTERIARRRRERQLRLRGQVVSAIGALRAGLRLGADDLLVPVIAPRGIAALAGEVRQALARLLGVGKRCWVGVDELLQHPHGPGIVASLGVQVRGLHERFTLYGATLGGVCRDPLELRGSLARAAGFRVRHGELAGDLRLQLMLRELAPKILEHADGALPLFEGQQLRGGVVLRIGADLRFRGHAPDAQEILYRPAAIAGLLLRLALLVYAGGEAPGEAAPHLVILAGGPPPRQEPGFPLGIIALAEAS